MENFIFIFLFFNYKAHQTEKNSHLHVEKNSELRIIEIREEREVESC